MAFTEKYTDPQRWTNFQFFATGGDDGAITESIAPGKPWRLGEIRFHADSGVVSAIDLILVLSAAQGSVYNMTFFSYAIQGSTDYWFQLSQPMDFLSDDQMILYLSIVSAINVVGITAVGWSARG
jgi:hypothetical protein